MQNTMRSAYQAAITDDRIEIVDLDAGGKSVTNDMHNVIADLVAKGVKVDDYLIVYRDSMGRWDGVFTCQERFQSFVPGGAASTPDSAANAVLSHKQAHG